VKRLFRAYPVQVALAVLLTAYLKLTLATLRWRREGGALAEAARTGGKGVIVCFWHGRIALTPPHWPRVREQAQGAPRALISLSPDGAFIARTMAWMGYPAIRGSSVKTSDRAKPKGGAAAFRETLAWIRGGGGIAMTPDGPRGPAETMTTGAVRLAQASGSPVLMLGLACSPALRLKSWDRTVIPLPFGRAAVVWSGPFQASGDADPEALRLEWEAALAEASARAEALAA
jgi:lysophospholipid acyltransferase (LPLAT)-like uncharacterized protein